MKQSIDDITSGFMARNPRKEKTVSQKPTVESKAQPHPAPTKKEGKISMSINQFEQQKEMMKRTKHVSALVSPIVWEMTKSKMEKDGIRSINELINRALLKYCEGK